MQKVRDIRFDILKALSIALVFIGHIMQFGFKDYSQNAFFNTVWALQIPLFMFVSGFFTVGGGTLLDSLKKIKKRAIAYLLPFVTYFYVINVLVLGRFQRNFLKATKTLLYSLESSLWFLFVVFILSATFILSDCVGKGIKNPILNFIVICLTLGVLLIPWAVICVFVSTSFLGAKFVLYYSLFFGLGFFVRKCKSVIGGLLNKPLITNALFTVCLLIFGFIIFNTYLCAENDGLLNIALRLISGVTGIVLCGLICKNIKPNSNSKLQKNLLLCGANTLEIYFAHSLAVKILSPVNVNIFSFEGFLHLSVYFVVVAAITFCIIALFKANKFTNLLFFGKRN